MHREPYSTMWMEVRVLFACLVMGLLVGCSTSGPATEGTIGDVESRGVTRAQRQMQPGAPDQVKLPTWPQQFEVGGPDPVSFGFAITQPGPIAVDVQWGGPPLQVVLHGPASAPITQAGSGRLHLTAQATPQDVQRSPFWRVQLRLQSPGPNATGTITVQAPPADPAAVQAQLNAMASQRQAERQRAAAEAKARIDAGFQEHKTKFEQEQQRKRDAAMAQVQPLVQQLRGNMAGLVRSRGLDEPQTTEGQMSGSDEGATRGLPGMRQQPLIEAPLRLQPLQPAPAPPAPAPVITRLSVAQGQPLTPVIVEGKNFGPVAANGAPNGNIVFVVAPNREVAADIIQAWSDTVVVALVPDLSGLMTYDGQVYVLIGSTKSNGVPFRFLPALETREIYWTTDRVIAEPGLASSNKSGDLGDILHGPSNFFQAFFGSKGDDMLFPSSHLKNGWTVQYVGVSYNFQRGGSDASVVDSRVGTDTPYMKIHWWYDAFHDLIYQFLVRIAGPRGVADGIKVP